MSQVAERSLQGVFRLLLSSAKSSVRRWRIYQLFSARSQTSCWVLGRKHNLHLWMLGSHTTSWILHLTIWTVSCTSVVFWRSFCTALAAPPVPPPTQQRSCCWVVALQQPPPLDALDTTLTDAANLPTTVHNDVPTCTTWATCLVCRLRLILPLEWKHRPLSKVTKASTRKYMNWKVACSHQWKDNSFVECVLLISNNFPTVYFICTTACKIDCQSVLLPKWTV